ncbi:MAG: cytochrome c biogenesis protein CcdA, partial [Myxococcota bacterium]
ALLPRVRDASPEAKAEESNLSDQIKRDGLLWVLLLVFLAGVGASLTPCVYPLIPITISVFGARDADSRLQAFGLSSIYVLGIVATYTVLGLVAGLAGQGIGEAMKNPFVLGGIAALMIAMGLSSFGLFELQLPSSLQNKLSAQGGKGVVGALVMGLVAGLVATPCVGPILVAILVFVAQTQDMALGALMLATFALGMGMLFLVLGTFANLINKLPRSGTWMVGVKTVFGVVFMVVALYYLRLALPFLKAPVLMAWKAAQAIAG